MSSELTKRPTSMISTTRLQKKADEKFLMSKNQIGFSKRCRIADHLVILKVLVNKHVTKGENKLNACFVDLGKPYDSVPHRNLFDQLRKLGLNGEQLDLVENLYKRTKCAVKVNGKITNFFTLSCLLFNLYENDIIHVLNQVTIRYHYLIIL